MSATIATLVCCAGILGLFLLDRDRRFQASPALWIAVAWFLLACSRSVSGWLNPQQSDSGLATAQLLEGNPLDRAVYTVLLLLGLMVLLNRRQQVAKILRHSGPILLFFSYCLVSLIWSDFPGVAFKRWNKAIGDLVMVLLIWTDPQPVTALKRLLARLTYTLIPLSVLLIKYYPALGRTYGRWFGETEYIGVTLQKNTLGAICMLFGLASIWRVFSMLSDEPHNRQRVERLIVQGVILAMIFWLFSIIDSVTALSSFLLAGCVLLVSHFRLFVRNRLVLHCLVLVTVLVPAAVAFLDFSPGTLHALGRNSTLTERTDLWSMVIHLSQNNPWVGTGYESFWLGPRLDAIIANVTVWWVPNQSHNGYLEVFANLGWLGVGGLAMVIFWGYTKITRAWRQNLPASSLMLAYFAAGIVSNFTEAAFFRMMTPMWLFLLIAITMPQVVRNNCAEDRSALADRFAGQGPAFSFEGRA